MKANSFWVFLFSIAYFTEGYVSANPSGQISMADLTKGADSQTINGGVITVKSSGETCIMPKHYILKSQSSGNVLSDYKEKDRDEEAKLCNIDFSTSALCPKLESTNPGILVLTESNGKTGQLSDELCWALAKDKATTIKKEAKFKQTIGCSNTSSILTSYHLARMFGAQVHVPVAVVKTMPREQHIKFGNQARRILKQSEIKPTSALVKLWKQFEKPDLMGDDSALFLENGKYLYGALADNPNREVNYSEIYGGKKDDTYITFKLQLPFKRVSSDQSLDVILTDKNKSLQASLPIIQQMADVSNMLIFDALQSQQDRIGNIHFYVAYGYLDNDGKVKKKTLSKSDFAIVESLANKTALKSMNNVDFINMTPIFLKANPELLTKLNEKGIKNANKGVLVREMLLKDNDCGGIKKSNRTKDNGDLIGELRHITPETYQAVMALQNEAKNNSVELESFFNDVLLRDDTALKNKEKGFLANLDYVANTLRNNCKNKKLKIDLEYSYDAQGNFVPSQAQTPCE
jgi:hypothetical protein